MLRKSTYAFRLYSQEPCLLSCSKPWRLDSSPLTAAGCYKRAEEKEGTLLLSLQPLLALLTASGSALGRVNLGIFYFTY